MLGYWYRKRPAFTLVRRERVSTIARSIPRTVADYIGANSAAKGDSRATWAGAGGQIAYLLAPAAC